MRDLNLKIKPLSDINVRKWLHRPSDFGLNSDHPKYEKMFKTWSLGPVILTRDSTLLEQSNSHVIREYLKGKKGWMITQCNHWACGWVDHLSFQVYKSNQKITNIAHIVSAILDKIEDYPLLDEDHHSQIQHEATMSNIEEAACRYVNERAPKSYPGELYHWFSENDPEALEDRDDQGAYPSTTQITSALKALKWLKRE